MQPVCLYHANCIDGFTAAWVVNKFYEGNVDLIAVAYGDSIPQACRNRDVILVDFSFKRDRLHDLKHLAKSVLVLDHHKTAEEDLRAYAVDWPDVTPAVPDDGQVMAIFDMDRSGAGLAWDWFFPKRPRPAIVKHVEDRDLWRFRIEGTRSLHGVFASYPFDLETWDKLAAACEDGAKRRNMLREGEAIARKHLMDVRSVYEATKRKMIIGGYPVMVCNAPPGMASDLGNLMAKMQLFGVTYFDTADGKRAFSLRSIGDFDVSAIAKDYGGGGHRNAAGFSRPKGWEGDT